MKKPMTGTTVAGTMTWSGKEYDIIRFGCRLRIVGRRDNRSLNCRGYMDINEIRREYPQATVVQS